MDFALTIRPARLKHLWRDFLVSFCGKGQAVHSLPYPLDLSIRQRIVAHLVSRVEATPLCTDPFPHIGITEFLPPATYTAMLDQLPQRTMYEPFQYHKHHQNDGSSNRLRFLFDNSSLQKLDKPRQELWFAVRSALGSDELRHAVFRKLAPGLAFRYGCEENATPSLPGFALPELFHEVSGYRIAPHPDTRKKVVTMQISLAADANHPHFGTEFYRRSLQPSHWLCEPRGFEVVKTMPYVPNAAYAFVVLNSLRLKSWHGRSTLPVNTVERNTILNIWYDRPELGNLDLVREQDALVGRRAAA